MKTILAINAGSSSLKMELFESMTLRLLGRAEYKEIGSSKNAHAKALKRGIQRLELAKYAVLAIGHRVVHGGSIYSKPTRITKKVLTDMAKLSSLAPLHNPANLAAIQACKKLFPKIPQVACFDTAFHNSMPQKASLYAIPLAIAKKYHIKRYGFHGTSHEYVTEQARKKLGTKKTKRTVTCHLGNGCSLTAVLNGKSVDTTMGFTPLEGIPMGTRSGNIDPSVVFYLMKKGWPAKKIEHLLNYQSGLKGVSGISSDMKTLLKSKSKSAKLAIEIFCYSVAKGIIGLAAALKGLDCIVFTGGIGENARTIRNKILRYFPVKLKKNIKSVAIKTDEGKHIAQLTKNLLA